MMKRAFFLVAVMAAGLATPALAAEDQVLASFDRIMADPAATATTVADADRQSWEAVAAAAQQPGVEGYLTANPHARHPG